MTPDLLTDFIRNNAWGKNDLKTLLELRTQILAIVDNDEKGLSFLSKNKLIFVFQKNIVKSLKKGRYVKWFKFAEKTKNENNEEKDFEEFKNDPIFMEIMNELVIDNLDTDDFQYIVDYAAFEERSRAYEESVDRQRREEAMVRAMKIATEKVRKQYEPKFLEVQEKLELIEKKSQKAEQEKQKAEQDFLEQQLLLIQKFLKRGDSNEEIADFLEIEPSLLAHYITLLPK